MLLSSLPAPPGVVQGDANPPAPVGTLGYEKSYPGSAFAALSRVLQPRLADFTGGLLNGVFQVPGDVMVASGGIGLQGTCDSYDDSVLAICNNDPITGTHYVDKDWIIKVNLTIQNAHLIFQNTRDMHHAILAEPGIALTITGSTFDEETHDRASFGFLVTRGTTVIQDSYFNETMVGIFATSDNYGAGSSITNTRFDHSITALTTNQNLAVRGSVFTRSYTGILVNPDVNGDRKADLLGTGNPLVTNSTFEMNEIALHMGIASSGNYSRNRIAANGLGVWCWGNGDQNDDGDTAGNGYNDVSKPRINQSNIYQNYAEAYSGVYGAPIGAGGVNVVKIPGSACQLDGNYVGTNSNPLGSSDPDSRFLGQACATVKDAETNLADAPLTLTAPALPWNLTVISSATTWDDSHSPPTIDGPVIVNSAGKLTVNKITLDTRGFTIGAKLNATIGGGASIRVMNSTLAGSTTIYLRNTGDYVYNVTLRDEAMFEGVFSMRNSATVDKLVASNLGPNAAGVFMMSALVYATGEEWKPFVKSSVIEHAAIGIMTVGNLPTIQDNSIRHTRGPGFQAVLAPGLASLTDRFTFQRNSIHNATIAANVAGKSVMASSYNTLDGGAMGYVGLGLDDVTFSHDTFTNFLIGHMSVGDLAVDVQNSLFAFNLLSMGAVETPIVKGNDTAPGYVTVATSNFNYSYGAAVFTWDIPLIVSGNVFDTRGRIQCNHNSGQQCYLQDDESADNSGGGLIDISQLAANPNAVTPPGWWGHINLVEGQTLDLKLADPGGPVIARHGGTIRAVDGAFDLNGFPVGAKSNGPNSSATPGQLIVENAHLKNGAYLGLGSPSDHILVRNSTFTNFTATTLAMFQTAPTVTCNQFSYSGGAAYVLKGTSDGLTFDHNLVRNTTQGISAGFERRIPNWHENVLVNHSGFLGVGTALLRNANARMDAHNSAFMERTSPSLDNRNIAFLDHAYVAGAPRANLTDSYWGHATLAHARNFSVISIDTAPDVLLPSQNVLYDGYGLDVWLVGSKDDGSFADWNSTSLTMPPALTPCAAFTYAPLSPLDSENVTFDGSLSFDPAGAPLANYSWDFGDQSASYEVNPTHKFADGSTYTVTLTIKANNIGNLTATATRQVVVLNSTPHADFAWTVVDEMHDVQFNDTSTHPNTPVDDPPAGWTYAWNFNNEGTSSARNASFRFADGGAKTVTLTVTDNDGVSNTASHSVTVPHVPPVADFASDGGVEIDPIVIVDNSTTPNPNDRIVRWDWVCSDGTTSSNTTTGNLTHRFPDGTPTSSATCSLTVTDDDGQTNTTTRTISVQNWPPTPLFNASDVTELEAVSFTDQSTHQNANDTPPAGWTYSWNFSGEGTSSERNPSFRFADGGDKTVTLTATDNDGASASVSKTVHVRQVPPTADFTWSPPTPNPNQNVSFTDASTHPNPNDTLTGWAWDFGDGSQASTQNPTHAFAVGGSFNVTLSVTDDDGMVGSVTRQVLVGNRAPTANFTFTPPAPTDEENVTFNGTASFDPDGNVTSWAWDFGDGNTSAMTTNATVTHRYGDNGTYYPSLTVTDDLNATSKMTRSIQVADVPPTAGFSFTFPIPFNDTANFTDQSTDQDGRVVAWRWDFGDGNTSTEQNPSHLYSHDGRYHASLNVTDDDGSTDATTQEVIACGHAIDLILDPDPNNLHAELDVCLQP